jgi:hypothetical protein
VQAPESSSSPTIELSPLSENRGGRVQRHTSAHFGCVLTKQAQLDHFSLSPLANQEKPLML